MIKKIDRHKWEQYLYKLDSLILRYLELDYRRDVEDFCNFGLESYKESSAKESS